MRRIFIIISFLFISYIILPQDDKPKPVVAVLMLENREQDSCLDVLCCTIKDTIGLTLKLMGKYRVIEDETVIGYEKTDKIRQYAIDNKVDNVMFGRTLKNDKGQILIQMSAYDKFQDKVTITEQQVVDTIFEVFNAADELVVALLEGFSGIRVAYGFIKLANTGTDGDYTVFIDNQQIGDTLTAIDKVFIGKHRLRITQRRVFAEHVLFDEYVLIEEEKEVAFEFAIPYLTEEEESEFNRIDRFVFANWDNSEKKQEVENELVKVCGLLEEVKTSTGLIKLNDRYKKICDDYKSLSSAYARIDTKYIPTSIKEDIGRIMLKKATFWRSEDIRELVSLKSSGILSGLNKQYQTKPDWNLFALLAANPMTTESKFINSFAEPILKYIAEREPSFEDDFSKNTGWNRGWSGRNELAPEKTGYRAIKNGKLYLYADRKKNGIAIGNSKMYYKNFYLNFDLVVNEYYNNSQDFAICFNISDNDCDYVAIHPNGASAGYTRYGKDNGTIKKEINSFLQVKETINLTLILYNEYFAFYLNREPMFYVFNPGRIRFKYFNIKASCNNLSQKKSLATVDNFKIWNLSGLIIE